MPTLNKLEYLDETKQQIKNALNTNFNSQISDDDTFRSYVSKINVIYDNWSKVTGEDTSITLNNTKKGKMLLATAPSELTQETTTGTNYFNAYAINTTGIDVTNDGATITMPIISSGGGYTSTGKKLSVLCPTLQVGDVVYIYFTCTSSNNKTIYTTDGTYWISSANKTITQAMLDGTVVLYSNNATQGETSANVYSNLRIVKTQNAPFEKYSGGIPAPNPDYPQEVQVIKGNNSIKIENKNLLYWTRPTQGTVVENDDGSFTLNYTYAQSLNMVMTGELSTGTYTIKNYGDIILYVQSSSSDYSHYASANGGSYTFTYDGTSYLRFLYGNTTANTTQLFKVQLEKGSTATDYVAHQEQVLPINLPNGMEYCKIGDYEDEFEHNGDKWYLNKYIGKVVLDGSENWTYYNDYVAFGIGFNYGTAQTTKYCNYFKAITSGITTNDKSVLMNANSIFIHYEDMSGNTTTFKTWLGTHNTIIYYPLATPTHDEITDPTLISQLNAIEQAVSYDEQTNISQVNTGLPFVIGASALIKGGN